MVIYRVAKCEIDLPTMRVERYSEVDMTKKCQKVWQSAIKCDTIGHVNHNQDWPPCAAGCSRMVGRGAERLCVNDYSLSHHSLPHVHLPSHTRMYSSGVF